MSRISVQVGIFFLLCAVATPAFAQYFGRNKVQYDSFEFQTFETDHFLFHFYPEEKQAVIDASRMGERWYRRHSRTYMREFKTKKPIIFYANDADFHQTNAIGGTLGEGTGGVTESLKERVVMPLTGLYAETDHVLGHELVHSFQYDIGLGRADSVRFALGLLPLWLIEGTAEYLSVGREDAHTAMWLRDAALRDDLPTVEQMTREPYKYFPYRYGQAYMAYVGGKYGDAAVANLFKLGGRVGLDSAFVYTLGITADSLSNEWIATVKDAYLPMVEDRTPADSAGRPVLVEGTTGSERNLAPVISPDGKYIAFLSDRDLFNINLFIADAETGQVVKKLKGTTSDPHFDAIRFISTAGSWSPDGKQFAFITFVEGDNEIAILDWNSGEVKRRIAVEGVSAITNVAWSPIRDEIVFTGLDGGISDLYLLDLETNAIRQLTNDRFGDLQPAWSPDGKKIAFVTDRGSAEHPGTNFETLEFAKVRLAVLDLETNEIDVIRPFADGEQVNPQFSPDGRSLYFLANYDGFKDIYRYAFDSGDTYQITRLQTGVSGITKHSPAMTVSAQSGRMVFSVYADNGYSTYSLEAEEAQGTLVTVDPEEASYASILPPFRAKDAGLVADYLNDPLTGLPEPVDPEISDYGAKLQLDYVAPPTIGVSAGGPFGGGVAGGVAFFFSDMLGNHNLYLVAQANGTFKDIGGQASYLNRKNRFNFGASVGHIPIVFGGYQTGIVERDGQTFIAQDLVRQRIYIDQAQGLASYPLTTTRRFEFEAGFTRYGFDYEVERYLFSQFGFVDRERTNLDDQEPDPVYFFQSGAALVGDFSFFGFTSPIQGGRYRFGVTPYVGTETYVQLLADYRRYLFFKPFTFALRGMHIGNYGATEGNTDGGFERVFTREYLGYSNNTTFVRGYNFNSFEFSECASPDNCSFDLNTLAGTRVALFNAEVRIPLLGTEQFGLINFPYLPTELLLFTDAGITWRRSDEENGGVNIDFNSPEIFSIGNRQPVVSAGVATRMNLFGYLILEIYYANPFQRPDKGAHFGFQLIPGW